MSLTPRPAVVPPAGRRDSRRPPLFVAGSPIWFAWLECRITDFTRRIAQESLDGRIEEIANAVSGA
ncbi:hypothetical protein [Amycolatopsis sp. YIM 10]|uniref:hypothetical protein n=1 Tax=Amycolatopsis sp. YIM 10 TaxID=2653857 RepID=UPI0012904375|nr:hypothetical protein [Amycolatopsis sp. YIM 10]